MSDEQELEAVRRFHDRLLVALGILTGATVLVAAAMLATEVFF